MDINSMAGLLKSWLKSKLHPRNEEIRAKYPELWANENIREKLFTRYPSTEMSDDEFRQKWWGYLSKADHTTRVFGPPVGAHYIENISLAYDTYE